MTAGAVSGQTNSGWIAAVFLRMFHNVGDRPEDIFDKVRHRVARRIAVSFTQPPVIDAEDDEPAALRQFPGESAHDVFIVGVPSTAVNDDDARKISRAFG